MGSAARSLWNEPAVVRPVAGVHWHDWVFAAAVLAAAAVEALLQPPARWAFAAAAVVLALAVLVRRVHPLASVGLGFGALFLTDAPALFFGLAPVAIDTGAVVLVLVYSLLRWAKGRDIVLGAGIVLLEFLVAISTDPGEPTEVIGGAAVLFLAAALGTLMRYRGTLREQLIEGAKLKEREYLARELHDTVAHHVSAIVIAAQSGQVLARSATREGALEALEAIEHEAAGALVEMRTIVGALRGRGYPSPLAPSHGVAEIKDLAVSGEGALEVQVSLAGDLAGLVPGVEAALFRVAQEAVTNARRHARAASLVRVTVSGGISEVELCVVDDGLRAGARAPGYGMTGMAERIALLGGTLEAGPGATRGWLVSVVLPRTGRR